VLALRGVHPGARVKQLGKEVRFVQIPATSLDKVGDVANALARIGEPDDGPAVVFVDEVHAVCKKGQLLLLSALEDGWFQPVAGLLQG
jgi:Holliday junction resolvasome RuvABC ATP-dependent DNA helicase subunit